MLLLLLTCRSSSTVPTVSGALPLSACITDGVMAGFAGVHVRLPFATAITVLLLISLPICTVNGTAHPVATFCGTLKTIWSSPMQQPDRPW